MKKLIEPRKGGRLEKLRDFIEAGNEPTTFEISEFLEGNTSIKSMAITRSVIARLRKYFLNRGRILIGYPSEESGGKKMIYRYKLCERGEEVLTSLEKNERQVIGSYRNLLRKNGILNTEFKNDLASINSARKIILTLQKQIIDNELLLLNNSDDDDSANRDS